MLQHAHYSLGLFTIYSVLELIESFIQKYQPFLQMSELPVWCYSTAWFKLVEGCFLLDRKTFSSAHWIKLSNEMPYILSSRLCKLQPGHMHWLSMYQSQIDLAEIDLRNVLRSIVFPWECQIDLAELLPLKWRVL